MTPPGWERLRGILERPDNEFVYLQVHRLADSDEGLCDLCEGIAKERHPADHGIYLDGQLSLRCCTLSAGLLALMLPPQHTT